MNSLSRSYLGYNFTNIAPALILARLTEVDTSFETRQVGSQGDALRNIAIKQRVRSCSLHLCCFRFINVRLGEHGMLMSNNLRPRRNHSPPCINLDIHIQNINTLNHRLYFNRLILLFEDEYQVSQHSL